MNQTNQFHSPTKGRLSFDALVKEILDYLNEDKKRAYKIVIGTDSQAHSPTVDFIAAIVIHRVGKGGRYFWQKIRKHNIYHLRQKIYTEVNLSLKLAKDFIEKLKEYISCQKLLSKDLEIHVDIGQNGETREMIKEVVGMVRGNGFNVKYKPDAYGASKVADRHS